MPFIVPVISWIAATLAAGGLNAFLLSTALSLGASLVLGAVSKLFSKGSGVSSLTNQVASRTVTSRQFKD
ncbi:MAG: hypothetical protein DMG44_14430 [Acidobacteria bacterium]|nr:MAG: hypothetical protein DMG44_14430 [Acidobacteriota bacterium]